MRWWHIPLALILSTTALLAWMAANARVDPVVRRATIAMPDWPAGAPPVKLLLWSDLHLGNRATDARRLTRIADQVNALKPDLVVLAGGFVAGHERADADAAPGLTEPLARLRPSLGVVAVLGNHDYWTHAATIRAALERAGVRVLANEALRAGPLALAGLDDRITRHARLSATRIAMARVGGAPVLLTHTPEVPGFVRGLVVAGHTHCGQIVLPIIGPPVEATHARSRCGIIRDGDRTTVVTAGTGTSVLPLRFAAPPDLWLLTLRPAIR